MYQSEQLQILHLVQIFLSDGLGSEPQATPGGIFRLPLKMLCNVDLASSSAL